MTILIIDDDPAQRRIAGAMLDGAGRDWRAVEDGETALELLRSGEEVSLALLDLTMPGMSGFEVLAALRPIRPDLPVIVLTSNGSISNAVEAMKAGANDFLIKPVSPERLETSIATHLKIDALRSEVRRLSPPAGEGFEHLVAEAQATRAAIRLAERAAQSNIPVLIEGESGVGKEVFAQGVHAASARAGGPFIAVNCGALPENLVESILFGHEKGAFTGAVAKRIGKFEEADGGTLFLDEIGELPLDAQVKLLRAVQEGEVDPVGGAKTVKSDFRLISATNRDLATRVGEGAFREDLYYRISVYPLTLPPLRDRQADIAPLARRFMSRFAAEEGKQITMIDEAAEAMLTAAPWPGNVRQLENAVYRAVVMAEGEVLSTADFTHIRPAAAAPADMNGVQRDKGFFAPSGHIRPLAEIELEAMTTALDRYDGSMSEAARRLGIGRSTLYRRLQGDD